MQTATHPAESSTCAIFYGPGKPFSMDRVRLPELREGELLVRNEFTTLCRSDVNTYCGKRTEKTPTILGHEIVGRIAAFGANAPRSDARCAPLNIGDRITWAIYASDPSSALARCGIPQKGPDLFKYGHEAVTAESHLHGGLAEYCVLRCHTPIVRLSTAVPLPVAALINCSAATVAGALRLAGGLSAKRILITGAGMLGVFACAMAHVAGAQAVIAADICATRLTTALRFGATDTVQLTGDMEDLITRDKIDVHLDFSGDPATVEQSLHRLAIGACSVLVGATYPQRDLSVNAEVIVRNLLTIRGLHNYNQDDLIMAVNFVEAQHVHFPFHDLIDDGYSLRQVNEAFEHAHSSGAYRVGIHTSDNLNHAKNA